MASDNSRKTRSSTSAETSAKRTKLDEDVAEKTPFLIWEWQDIKTELWTAYSTKEQKNITSSSYSMPVISITSPVAATLDLDQMSHKVNGSNEIFPVRCRTIGEEYCDSWQWLDDDSTWKDYTQEAKRRIETASVMELYNCDLKLGKFVYTIDFSKMHQKNNKTGGKRRIRKYDAEKDPSFAKAKWQWMDDTGKWKDYSDELNIKIEKEFSGSKSNVTFTIGVNNYQIDFVTKLQLNLITKIARQTRRVEPKSSITTNNSNSSTTTISFTPTSAPPPPTTTISTTTTTTTTTTTNNTDIIDTDDVINHSLMDASTSSNSIASTSKSEPKESKVESYSTETTVKFTGKAMVDKAVHLTDNVEVYSENDNVYDVTLNQTNVSNNNNKFYIIQLLTALTGTRKFFVFTRWGRVGLTGSNSIQHYGSDLEGAKAFFEEKFYDKTKNAWSGRDTFVKVQGKYDIVSIDYGEDKNMNDKLATNSNESETDKKDIVESKLHKHLQALIEFICDVRKFESIVKEMKYDTKKAPLGKLTEDQLKAGFSTLKKIEQLIHDGKTGTVLTEACNEFYTRIPHCFGMSRPPVLYTSKDITNKLALLETLGDIQLAINLMSKSIKSDVHQIDQHYLNLYCDLELVSRISDEFQMIQKYVTQTHGPTHSQYSLLITSIFKAKKDTQNTQFIDHGNRKLLWHGSRLTNWVGILSQGLRIAPPEAPVTGYMFGKGIYFADVASKSANYCYATSSQNEGCLLLCEVSLGTTNDLTSANPSANKLPKGKHSIVGLGKMVPDPGQELTLEDGCKVPLGNIISVAPKTSSGYALLYNEYVVYDVKQVKFRYLVRVEFHFS